MTAPQFTPQQSAAILAKGVSIALSAGAGCGKTFVLTQRFLAGLEHSTSTGKQRVLFESEETAIQFDTQIARSGRSSKRKSDVHHVASNRRDESAVDLHELVAITFTDRAAREMRDRIRAACNDRLKTCEPDDVDHWLKILRGLDSARISTIHSFCSSLLRSQAVEAGLDPRFILLEQPLAETLLRHVVRDTFHALLEKEDDDAMQFLVQFGLERAKELLRRLTAQCFRIEFGRFDEMASEQLAKQWLTRWHAEFVPKLIATFRESTLVTHVLEAIDGAPSKNPVMIERIANLQSTFASNSTWQNPVETLEFVIENARIQGGGGKKDWLSEEQQEQIKVLFEKLRKEADSLRDRLEYRQEDVVASAELACRALRLTQRIADQYTAAKRAQGVLDFDDLLIHTRNLLRDNESVRQRVAAGIRLLMVDEFQDTDPVQADVVRSLCGAALKHGKLFMVGDRKQSIYRFRRADPAVFARLSDELPSAGRLPLNVNFRSQPAVLNFVNQSFAPVMDGYEPLVPFQNEQYSPLPAVEFLFATFDAYDGPSLPAASGSAVDDDVRPNASQLRAREADWIARRIHALIHDPIPRIRTKEIDATGRPKLRPAKCGDIVILFRALTSVQEYEGALQRYNLPYYLVGGKAFFAQQEVFDILNLCRYLDDCDDLIGLVGILRSPFFNLSDDSLQALAFHPGSNAESPSGSMPQSLHETLYLDPPTFLPEDQRDRIRFAAEVLTELRAIKDRIPLSELLNRAIEQTGYDASLLGEFLGERKLANLRKLIEMARTFEQGDTFTLKDFVTRLQTSVLEETDEEFAATSVESEDTIRLMSIHQSKGLEFPIVIVADIDRKGPPRSGDSVLHPELGPLIRLPQQFGIKADNLGLRMHHLAEKEADAEETIRLFYVACTRAADYLIISAGVDTEKPMHSPWMELIKSRFDTNTGLLKTDPLLGSSTAATAGRETVPQILIHHKPCEVTTQQTNEDKPIPVGQIPGRVLNAEIGELPATVRIVSRDAADLPMTSVSHLETIDQELRGGQHYHGPPITDADGTDVIDLDLATTLGKIVHSVLEQVDFRDSSNWTDLLLNAASRSQEKPTDEILRQAQMMLERFFDSNLADELAHARSIRREIDFLLPWPLRSNADTRQKSADTRPPPIIVGIIDALVETESGLSIFDYKTGDFPANKPDEQLLAPYELQLGIYAHAVEQWYGKAPIELSLIAFKPKVRRITLPWSKARWNKIKDRVSRALETIQQATK